ncbi:MAG: polysaccharide biosynthesis protein [Planctomycetes bacterium]|nr:polysaccharide biosynthesis protein [Planctomycetota bacterium]
MEPARFRDRSILVTGGTGSIGSEIVRQLLLERPKVVRIFSRDETRQALLKEEHAPGSPVRYLLGDVRDRDRLRSALDGIDTVFHAAALKHVAACEYNPFEAVQTNVIGTQNLIEMCRETGVRRLVAISTDKAVNPVNTMGATKLLAENVLSASQEWNRDLTLCTVRFGNVLGSRGSLLPLLVRQIEEHGEVRLTSPDMTRFMMTIGDAVQLVLVAGTESKGGENFILKMPALRIGDLIRVFVREYCEARGRPANRVRIREIGVRPGEKLHEELITRAEAERVEERERLFVVHPHGRLPREAALRRVPAECDSARAAPLGEEEIRALLFRSGFLRGVQAPAPVAVAVGTAASP